MSDECCCDCGEGGGAVEIGVRLITNAEVEAKLSISLIELELSEAKWWQLVRQVSLAWQLRRLRQSLGRAP